MEDPCKYLHVVVTRHDSPGASLLRADFITQEIDTPTDRTDTPAQSGSESRSQQGLAQFEQAKPLIHLALPSSNPSRRTDDLAINVRISKNVDSDGNAKPSFVVKSSIQDLRGEVWRKMISCLRSHYALKTQNIDTLTEDGDIPVYMNPSLIHAFLQSFHKPHRAVLKSHIPTSLAHKDDLLDEPPNIVNMEQVSTALDVHISAPKDYSALDFVDLTLMLGQEFFAQAVRDNRPLDLDIACFLQWLAANASYDDPAHEHHLSAVSDLVNTLTIRYRVLRSAVDFSEGVKLLQSSIDSCDSNAGEMYRDVLIGDLSSFLSEGLDVADSVAEDLESARQYLAERIIPHPPKRGTALNNLGYFYMKRYEKFGELDDLNTNIALLQAALEVHTMDDPQRQHALYNIIRSLHGRYTSLKATADLELTHQYCQESLALEAGGNKTVPRWELLWMLGDIVKDTDYDGSIAALRESLKLCPLDQKGRVFILHDLAVILRNRNIAHDRQLVEDAKESIALQQEAMKLIPQGEGYTIAEMLVDGMFQELHVLQAHASGPSDFDPVIARALEALALCGQAANRYVPLNLLGILHFHRFRHGEDPHDISEAHKYHTLALEVATAGLGLHARAKLLAGLAEIYLRGGTEFFDAEKGYEYLEMSLDDTHCSAMNRLDYMDKVLNHTFGGQKITTFFQHSKLAKLYIKAVRLLPEITSLDVGLDTGLQSLRKWEQVSMNATVFCYLAGEQLEALQMLEKGRAVFWSQAFRTRAAAPSGIPVELSKRLQSLSQQIEHIRFQDSYTGSMRSQLSPTLEYSRRRRITTEYDSLIKQIRELPGLADFTSIPVDQVIHASQHGPVVILVSSAQICIAYMLVKRSPSEQEPFIIRHQALDNITQLALREHITKLERANLAARNEVDRSLGIINDDKLYHMPQEAPAETADERAIRTRTKAPDTFQAILKFLWTELVKHIFSGLEIKPSSGRHRPRIWWCPTGDFTFLPIHAAGDYSRGGECCSDYVVSSYIPTVSALTAARASYKPTKKSEARVLLAAVPHPFRGSSLGQTVTELQAIAEVIPAAQRIALPLSDDALSDPRSGLSVATALEKLPEASILHLASHGVQDHWNPLQSGFLLRDEKLSIKQLMPVPLPHAFLAFLSACETAKGDQEYSEQVIHLAATMLFAGFKSVVGTMWSMSDVDGPFVAGHVYKQLFSGDDEYLDPNVVPYALDEAVQQLRARKLSPSRWATFIHLGM